MNQAIPWSIAGGVLVVAAAALVVAAPERKDPAFDFIAGNRPVTRTRSDRNWFRMDGAIFRSSCAGDTLWLRRQKTAGLTLFPSIR